MPKVYEALKLISGGSSADLVEEGLTLEVEQQLGDGIVRCIALGSTDGIKRGMSVEASGAPISVPVGPGTLGRIMDVLGRPIDEAGKIDSDELRPIHQAAPKFAELSRARSRLDRHQNFQRNYCAKELAENDVCALVLKRSEAI